MQKTYKMGKVLISIQGEDIISETILDELSPVETNQKDSDIEFNFVGKVESSKNCTFFSPIEAGENHFVTEHSELAYKLSLSDKMKIDIKSKELNVVEKYMPRFKNWNYMIKAEQIAKNFMYDVFDYTTQIANLENKQTYFHASTFEKNGEAIAIVAWGGIGKTTTMLKMITEEGWNFLSDDLGIIDIEGNVYRSPKKMQIYAYNLENQENIKRMLFNTMSPLNKFSWYTHLLVKGNKRVRRRVSAEELFGKERVAEKAKLTKVFFIERTSNEKFSFSPIETKELASRAASTVLSEIEPMSKIASAVHSAGRMDKFPKMSYIEKSTYEVLFEALSDINSSLIQIPKNAGPDELVEYIKARI